MTDAAPEAGAVDAFEDEAEDDYTPSRLLVVATFAFALIGLGLSIYMTYEHYTGNKTLACSKSGWLNCSLVTTSKYSRVLGIPVAVLGLVQYVAMSALCSPWAWRARARAVHIARFALSIVGMVSVLWLMTVELVILGAICEYCTGVHVVTFVLFVLIVQSVPRMLGWARR